MNKNYYNVILSILLNPNYSNPKIISLSLTKKKKKKKKKNSTSYTSVMFFSRNEANSYGSTKSPVGMYCLIKTRQVCKSSMPSPNFTLINRSL